MALLRAAPPPLPGELLASWVGRLACLYDAPPDALWRELTGLPPVWTWGERDARGPTADELARVAATVRLDAHALAATSVDTMLPAAPAAWLRARGPVPWHVPWCAAYLRDDRSRGQVPHLRRLWAAACVAVSPRHRAPLTDICPACADRTRAAFRWVRSHPIVICANCAADLAGMETAGAVPAGSVLADCPSEALAAVYRLQARLLHALRAGRPVTEWGTDVMSDVLTGALEMLAGHTLVSLGIVRLSHRTDFARNGDAEDRCRFDRLGAEDAFAVLASLAALLAWSAAEIERHWERETRRYFGADEPIDLARLWSCSCADGALLRCDRRCWPDFAAEVGTAVAATVLHDPEMTALQRTRRLAAAHPYRRPANNERQQRLAERILADPIAAGRLAATRTPAERRRVLGRLAREVQEAEERATPRHAG